MKLFNRQTESASVESRSDARRALESELARKVDSATPDYFGHGERVYGGARDDSIPEEYFAIMEASRAFESAMRDIVARGNDTDLEYARKSTDEICHHLSTAIAAYHDRQRSRLLLKDRPDMESTLQQAIDDSTKVQASATESAQAIAAFAQEQAAALIAKSVRVARTQQTLREPATPERS